MKYLIIKMRAGGGGTSAEGQVHLGHRERPRGALDCGQLRQLHCPLELQVDFLSTAPLRPYLLHAALCLLWIFLACHTDLLLCLAASILPPLSFPCAAECSKLHAGDKVCSKLISAADGPF